MHNSTARFSVACWLTMLLACFVLLSAPGTLAQEQERTSTVHVAYPGNLEDEHEHPFKQPVKIEFYRVMNEEARQRIITGLEKQKRQTDSPAQKERLDREIERVTKERVRLEYATVINAPPQGSTNSVGPIFLPLAEHEVHFIPINPANRKPVIMPFTLTQEGVQLVVAVSPEGGVIGGGPTIADMKAQIEELQKLVAALQERVRKLEGAK